MSALCRSRRELSNAYLLAKIGVDTAENEPLEVWGENSIQYSLHSLAPCLSWDRDSDLLKSIFPTTHRPAARPTDLFLHHAAVKMRRLALFLCCELRWYRVTHVEGRRQLVPDVWRLRERNALLRIANHLRGR